MSYPNYPSNRLVVNDVDLTTKFGLILVDGYTLEPPELKVYTVDVPGGNGVIDLSEALCGDVVYNNRNQEFTFYVIDTQNFEKVKTEVSNLLHGKSYDYKMTMDPDYTYHGRFTVSSYSHGAYNQGIVGAFKVKINAEPFKYKKQQVIRIEPTESIGGRIFYLPSGRLRVRPTIETNGYLRVIFNDKQYDLQKGSWDINDILFTEGDNEIYLCSYEVRNLTWKKLKDNNVTWGDFKQKRLFEWYKSNGDGTYVIKTWNDIATNTWTSLGNSKWSDLQYKSEETSGVDDAYIAYDWGDL